MYIIKGIFTFFILLYSVTNIFAATKINIISNKKKYDIEDRIQLDILFSSNVQGSHKISSFKGLENFKVIGEKSYQYQESMNEIITTKINLQLTLLAKKTGNYTIGPIGITGGTGSVTSSAINIEITGERININNDIETPDETPVEKTKSENEEEISNLNLDANNGDTNSSKSIIKKRKITGINKKEMKDIYKDKGFRFGKWLTKESIWFLLIVLLGIIGVKLVNKYIKQYLKKREKEIIIEKKPEKIIINYPKLIELLHTLYINDSKEVFYAQTSKILRFFLDDTVKKGLSKGSLKEVENFLKKQTDQNLKNKNTIIMFYKKIYFPEYAPGEDNKEERKNIITELENIVIQKEEEQSHVNTVK